MLRKIIYITLYILFFFSASVFADTIYLKNGNKVDGIIIKDAKDFVEIKINIGATVTFFREDIEKIDRDIKSEHSKMKSNWEAKKTKKEIKRTARDAFEEEQTRKGLVEYEGKWITPEKKERSELANIVRDVGKGHSETRFSHKVDKTKRSSLAKKLLDKGNWFIRETEHFSIFYRDLSQAKIVSDKAEYYFEKITYDLGYEGEIKWDKKCQIYIVENLDKWKEFLKGIGFNADLVGGFVPNYGQKEMFMCALSDEYLALTFPHELTHLIFQEIAGKNIIPLWLNEGLANYEASVTSFSNEFLTKYIKQGRYILLGDLLRTTAYPKGKKARELFYAQSEKLVEFLITQHGRKNFRKFCELILKDKPFKDSLFSVYKGDFEDLEDFNIKLVEYIVK
ncbi:peptidase MA family metallohydrolase [Candidatus Omnitrophota bacterium]